MHFDVGSLWSQFGPIFLSQIIVSQLSIAEGIRRQTMREYFAAEILELSGGGARDSFNQKISMES